MRIGPHHSLPALHYYTIVILQASSNAAGKRQANVHTNSIYIITYDHSYPNRYEFSHTHKQITNLNLQDTEETKKDWNYRRVSWSTLIVKNDSSISCCFCSQDHFVAARVFVVTVIVIAIVMVKVMAFPPHCRVLP